MTLHTFTFEGRSVAYRTDYPMHAAEWARDYLGITAAGCWAHFGDHHVWSYS